MTSKVHEVAAIVVKAIGLKEGDAFEPAHDGDPLRDDRSMGSFKIDDKTKVKPTAAFTASSMPPESFDGSRSDNRKMFTAFWVDYYSCIDGQIR